MGTVLGWLSGGLLDVIGKSFVMPFLNVWLKSKDVDLEKFKASSANATELAVAVLDANVKFDQIKAGYALSVLHWWPFRLILFIMLLACSARFTLALVDSTWWWIFGCTIDGRHVVGDACSWSFPAIHGTYAGAEIQYILFFVLAKPVDTAVSGTIGMVNRYLNKDK